MLRKMLRPLKVGLDINSAAFGAICLAVALGDLSAWWLTAAVLCLVQFPAKGDWSFVWEMGKGWRGGWRPRDAA